jgi:ParB-like chromosome segregation protein Spo0J
MTQALLFADDCDVIDELAQKAARLFAAIKSMSINDQIRATNKIKEELHKVSPFRDEPVDCVLWVAGSDVRANDYNPNSVAPPEMELLRVSIMADGYTQPIVTYPHEGVREVVDGFHRNRVGKECADVCKRIHGHLPVVAIKPSQHDKGNRIASTIRHNRARGKHAVDAMSDIVVELKRRNWSEERIARELGMDQDEILRLCQITGLAELFSDQQFSQSWDVAGQVTEDDFMLDGALALNAEGDEFRTVNTSDPERVFHTYDKWECHKAGFYNQHMDGVSKKDGEVLYAAFLRDDVAFRDGLNRVIAEWKHSCEHYLTNRAMNRIAWLGQTACCAAKGYPAVFRSGFHLLTEAEQATANATALEYLNKWLCANNRKPVTMEEATSDRQAEIY